MADERDSDPGINPDGAEAAAAIEHLNTLLEGRDKFIVSKGLWSEFVDHLPERSNQ